MSLTTLSLVQSFASGRLTADEFCNAYIEIFRYERDSDCIDPDALSLCLSTVFCLADAYSPDKDRLEGELDEAQLRNEVIKALNLYSEHIEIHNY
jgi:hypothetical protein